MRSFLWVKPSDFDHAARLRDLVVLARHLSPTLLFVEDTDLLAGLRHGNQRTSVLGELLNQLDGLGGDDDILTLATTNRPEALDEGEYAEEEDVRWLYRLYADGLSDRVVRFRPQQSIPLSIWHGDHMARRSIFATSSGVLLAAVSLASALHGQVPTTLNYQGRLLENTPEQDAVDGAVDVVFSIWSGPATDGAAVRLWSESWTGVTLADGIFSVLLGSNGSPLDPADFQSDPSLFLQLEIDGEILLPRQQLGSAPFAMVDEPANELQDLELTGDSLGLSGSAATVDLSSYRDDTDAQDLSLAGSTLSLSNDSTTVDLSGFLDNTDAQTLGLSGTSLSISGSGSTVNLSGFLDNTDSQNLSSVLAFGNSAGGQSITNVATLAATGLTCPSCVDGSDIASDTIRGNDINDNIYILHVECNGECSDMSLRDACDVIENLRGLSVHAELVDVSCVHEIPSTSANGFVTCDDGAGAVGDNECRAFNLRTLGDIPCIDGTGTDALVTCLETDIAK